MQWFSYRKANRERPLIGDRRKPSPLGEIQPDYWIAEYTTELINLLNILGLLVELEPAQSKLLDKICVGQLISADELRTSGALAIPTEAVVKKKRKSTKSAGPNLFGELL